jgi:predicted regulator of amino acid metabolism with ACT domain
MVQMLWDIIKEKVDNRNYARLKIIKKMIKLGLHVDDNGDFALGNLKISDVNLARTCNVERKTVRNTAKMILNDEDLSNIFKKSQSLGTALTTVSSNINIGCLDIVTYDTEKVTVPKILKIIRSSDSEVLTVFADNAIYKNRIIILTNKPISGEILQKLSKRDNIKTILIY